MLIIDYTLTYQSPFVDPRARKAAEHRGQFRDMAHFEHFARVEMSYGRKVADVVVVSESVVESIS